MGAGFTRGCAVSLIRQLFDVDFSVEQIVLRKKSSFHLSLPQLNCLFLLDQDSGFTRCAITWASRCGK